MHILISDEISTLTKLNLIKIYKIKHKNESAGCYHDSVENHIKTCKNFLKYAVEQFLMNIDNEIFESLSCPSISNTDN